MPKLHEVLAAEKTVVNAAEKMMTEAGQKFQRTDTFFQGHLKTLKMLVESPANKALEDAAIQNKELVTNVPETLGYALGFWAKAEDLLYQKNKTNQSATADVEFRGKVILTGLPVDELLGLENRLDKLRGVIALAPTLDASVKWNPDTNRGPGYWISDGEDKTVKTEKTTKAVVLYQATDKHPAQVKEVSEDNVVGTFSVRKFTGAITALQKANAMETIDELITEVKKARVRANNVDACTDRIGGIITDLIMVNLK